ncbi:MAG: hypothetical protein QOF00_1254 [Pseudonocardiales bacterium]|jgi:hypothetical protein|nr:hypothetical protein [Pseudonocardiales bacterium]
MMLRRPSASAEVIDSISIAASTARSGGLFAAIRAKVSLSARGPSFQAPRPAS